jgi:hypothetical protein
MAQYACAAECHPVLLLLSFVITLGAIIVLFRNVCVRSLMMIPVYDRNMLVNNLNKIYV